MSIAILDGKQVKIDEITQAHRFVGMWRPAVDPMKASRAENLTRPAEDRYQVYVCVCGSHLWNVDKDSAHWKRGCFDLPQYESAPKK